VNGEYGNVFVGFVCPCVCAQRALNANSSKMLKAMDFKFEI